MEFKLINEDIKFPTFNNKKFEELLKQPINKEIAIKDFKSLIDNMNLFIQNYIKIIKENINDFNNYLNSYNKRSYDYLMIAKSILYLISILSDNACFFIAETSIDIGCKYPGYNTPSQSNIKVFILNY